MKTITQYAALASVLATLAVPTLTTEASACSGWDSRGSLQRTEEVIPARLGRCSQEGFHFSRWPVALTGL